MSARRRKHRDRRRRRAVPWPREDSSARAAAAAHTAGQEHGGPMDAQQQGAVIPLDAVVAARPEDVESPEAIVTAVYQLVSGPAEREGERDWARFRTFFLPGPRFLLTRWGDRRSGQRQEAVQQWDVEVERNPIPAEYR